MRAAPLLLLLAGLAGAGAAHGATLQVALNHSVRLPVAGPAASVILGSPSVVDVSVVDSRTVFVSGKAPGATDVTVVDPLGRIVYHGDIVVGEGATVSVFRGSVRSDQACAPYCASAPTATGAAMAFGRAPASATSTGGAPFGGLGSAIANSIGAAGQAVAPR